MKLKTFARRAAAAGAVLAALTLAALPALAAPKVQVSTTNAVADHADILSDETEQYVNDVSIKLSDACGAQIGVYTLDELLGSTTMEGFAYDVFNAWGLGSDDLDNGVLLLLAPNEADGGDYYIMRGDGLESQLSFSTLGSLLDEYMEPYWVNGDYDTGTQKTVQALANRLCSIYGVTLNSSYTDTSAPDRRGPNVMGFVLLVVAVLLVIWLITYLMRPRGPRPPRGGGGGSSSPSYSITVDKTKNGTITVSPRNASHGDTVTITATPDKGYELEMLKVLDRNGDALKLTEKNGKYTFKMPSGKVTIKASFVEEVPEQIFKDVPANAYYYEAVKWAQEKGITGGIGNGLFGPNDPCTRAQIVTFLWRAAGSPAPKNTGTAFGDVKLGSFYEQAVAWAVENGITGGTGEGMFSPDATCTRAQSVTFLYRASGSPAVSGSAEFSDVSATAFYADAVAWAAKKGITTGIGGGMNGADNDCTRGQIVTFLWRCKK